MRKMWIALPKEIFGMYQDEVGNIIFKNYVLEEAPSEAQPIPQEQGAASSRNPSEEVLTVLEKIRKQQISVDLDRQNVKKLSKKFVIEKFSGKNANRSEWMNTFERECAQLGIEKDADKIETLRLFLEGLGADWYSGTLASLTIESKWSQWKQKFCETFTDKGWLRITNAISYKYLAGLLLGYALQKQNLLMQMDRRTPEYILINLIGAGLPSFARNRIDREKLKTVEDLFGEIGGLEYLMKNVEKKTAVNQERKPKDKSNGHGPCTICEKKGKNNRFYPESACWYKENNNERKKLELVKHVRYL